MNEIGLRRAAILLMGLPTQHAAALLGKLPLKHIEAVSVKIAQMESVSGEEQEEVVTAFLDSRTSAMYSSNGGLEVAKGLVREALGSNASDFLENLQQTVESLPFNFLKNVDPQTLLTFISEEHPQTIALLLSHLPVNYGSQVLSALPLEKQMSVIQRVATMGRTTPEAIEELERGLEARLSNIAGQSMANVGGVQSVAEMLNVSDRSVERTVMDHLSREDPALMDEIRRLMFVFEDIVKLSDRDVQTLLKNVETAHWALSLKGSSEALQNKIMRNMSSRAADNLREEMGYLGSVRVSEVEAVQQKIVDIIRNLEDTGELSRPSGEEEEEYVN